MPIQDEGSVHLFDILPSPENFAICSLSTNEIIGFINMNASLTLKALQNNCEIQLKTSLTTSEWRNMATKGSGSSDDTVDIDILGDENQSEVVGDFLSHAGFFLQTPRFDADIPYRNPHMISFAETLDDDAKPEPADHDSQSNHFNAQSSRPSAQALSNVLDNLQQHEYLHPVETNKSLTIELLL